MTKNLFPLLKNAAFSLILAMVISFFLKEMWNSGIRPQFGGKEMNMATSISLVMTWWMMVRVAFDAFLSAVLDKMNELFPLKEEPKNENI